MYPDIPPSADILFVGTAPGAVEEQRRRPFVGPSGKLLRTWLGKTDLLSRAGFANVELHRTPGNRDPLKKEVRACLPVLLRAIQSMQPRAIVCLGGYAARQFGFKGSVGSMVGRFQWLDGDVLVTVVYHPGAFLGKGVSRDRYAEMEALVLDTLEELKARLGGTRVPPTYEYVEAAGCWPPWAGGMAVDTETTGERDPRLAELEVVSGWDGLDKVLVFSPPVAWPLRGADAMFHNAQFDLVVLGRYGLPLEDLRCDDTMVVAWLLGETPLGLKPLSRKLLGVNVLEYEEARAAGGETWMNYVAQDPVLTWRLHEYLRPRLEQLGSAWYYDNVEMPLQPILAADTLRGFLVDQERLEELERTMERRQAALKGMLLSQAMREYNPNSPKQVAQVLYELGLLRSPTASTHSDLLPDHPYAHLLLSYRKTQTFLSRYIRPLRQVETVSCIYNTMGTETGRLSCPNRNLQNLPDAISRCLRARPGMVFVSGDYSQIELRLAAYLSRDEYLLSALREGRNLHEELCLDIWGVRTPELYTKAKSANFERLYGGGVEKRATMLGVTPARIRSIPNRWQQFDRWAEAQRRKGRREGAAWTELGLRRILRDADSSDPEVRAKADRESINTPVQGTAGGVCKYAQVLADPPMRQLGGYVLHQVHDSVMCEVPEERAQEAQEALHQAMQAAVPEDVKKVIEIPAKITVSQWWE